MAIYGDSIGKAIKKRLGNWKSLRFSSISQAIAALSLRGCKRDLWGSPND
ncbi:hypothetical protein [Coleofasciculus sp. FACHB-1120]|nr:hypothetical protein [Coleofasciculus sp. FACHB-1120]MBD2741682.1 hypothetical protein [Coleofasciculus sp. FACHB-1120]